MDLDPAEIRVLGCLIEKQRTTPDAYPLSLNALRAACNQTTNRDPVVAYDEETIREALRRLGRRGWTRLASGAGSRAAKYRHLLDENPGLSRDEQAVLAVLALRGAQTPGELRSRTERMRRFADFAELQQVLDGLIERGFTVRHPRRPGQKEERYSHLLGEDAEEAQPQAQTAAPAPAQPAAARDDRLDRLEQQVAALAAEVAELRAAYAARGGT